eukprot:SAG22_NODE_1829_length_3484_cov_2.530576_3_plen_60_part_00
MPGPSVSNARLLPLSRIAAFAEPSSKLRAVKGWLRPPTCSHIKTPEGVEIEKEKSQANG